MKYNYYQVNTVRNPLSYKEFCNYVHMNTGTSLAQMVELAGSLLQRSKTKGLNPSILEAGSVCSN